MKFSSLKKMQRIFTIALVCTIIVSIGLITALLLSHNDGAIEQNIEQNKEVASSASTNTANPSNVALAKKLDFMPVKCTLNQSLPNIAFVKEDGDKLTLESMRGKIVVLTFWASWCTYCKKELEQAHEIEAMLKEYPDVEYLLVNKLDKSKETKEQALTYLKENKILFKTVFDENMMVYNQLGLKVVPTTLIIDRQGVLRAWDAGGNLNAGNLKAKIDYANKGALYDVRNFITRELINKAGGVRANYLKDKDTALKNTDVLSESQGLIMEYAVKTNDKALFESSYKYVAEIMRKDPLTAWVVTENEVSRVNSSIDDLRIYRAMAQADELWGGYSEKLDNYEKALRHYNTYRQNLVNEYDFKNRKKSEKLKLCFADFEALKLLSKKSSQWGKVYQNSISTVENGYISDKFPLYYSEYDYSKRTYIQDDINMAEAMVTLLHLASIDGLKPKTIDWIRKAVEGEGIFARYKTDGTIASGYSYESTAIYGLVSMIATTIGDKALANKALTRMEEMRIFDSKNKLNGAFGNTDGTGIYSFDQCIALLAYGYE